MVVDKNSKKQDILCRKDIERLIEEFYKEVHKDPFLAPIFKMPPPAWKHHLSRTLDYWDHLLFQSGAYKGGLMWVHIQKHNDHPFTPEHFEHWLAHWFRVVDQCFEGQNAKFVKKKALQVGQIMNGRLSS